MRKAHPPRAAKSNDLEKRIHELEVKVATLQGILSVVSLIFILVSGLGGWKIYKYERFTAVGSEALTVMTNAFADKAGSAINRLTVVEEPDEQKRMINVLVDMQNRLKNAGEKGDHFDRLCSLVESLRLLVIDNDSEESYKLLEKLEGEAADDTFVRARALALEGLICISHDRGAPPAEVKATLELAAHLDGTVALAFNGLGIMSALDAQEAIKSDRQSEAMGHMNLAMFRFKTAADLDPSAIGVYKYLNNLVWGRLLVFRWYLDGKISQIEMLRFVEASDCSSFFSQCQGHIQEYMSLAPDLPVAYETRSQMEAVRSDYCLRQGAEGLANALLSNAFKDYKTAVEKNLCRRVVAGADAAIEQFHKDPLLKPLSLHPDYGGKLEEAIRKWYASQRRAAVKTLVK